MIVHVFLGLFTRPGRIFLVMESQDFHPKVQILLRCFTPQAEGMPGGP